MATTSAHGQVLVNFERVTTLRHRIHHQRIDAHVEVQQQGFGLELVALEVRNRNHEIAEVIDGFLGLQQPL